MKTIAVTIGIDAGPFKEEDPDWVRTGYQRLAKWSSGFVEKYLELETRIIGQEYLHMGVGRLPQSTVKLDVFEIFKDADRIVYFDADWRPVRKFNLFDYCPDPKKLYFTLDEQHAGSEYIINLEKLYNIPENRYVNGGFFVATREHHAHLFARAKKNWFNYTEHFWDQCVMNQEFNSEITIADKRLNVKCVSHGFVNKDILGFHNLLNHQIMEGWAPEPDWDGDGNATHLPGSFGAAQSH